jgi:hypothetical protein
MKITIRILFACIAMLAANGAANNTQQADATLLCCGLKNAYEGVIGMQQSGSALEKIA